MAGVRQAEAVEQIDIGELGAVAIPLLKSNLSY